jgi:hypothetical protein
LFYRSDRTIAHKIDRFRICYLLQEKEKNSGIQIEFPNTNYPLNIGQKKNTGWKGRGEETEDYKRN